MNHPITPFPHHLDSSTIENAPAIVKDEFNAEHNKLISTITTHKQNVIA